MNLFFAAKKELLDSSRDIAMFSMVNGMRLLFGIMRIPKFFRKATQRLPVDLFGAIAIVLVTGALIAGYRIYFVLNTGGVLHGGYLWLIFLLAWLIGFCVKICWKGEGARRSAFAEEPKVLSDFL